MLMMQTREKAGRSWAREPRSTVLDPDHGPGVDPVIMLTGPIPSERCSCWAQQDEDRRRHRYKSRSTGVRLCGRRLAARSWSKASGPIKSVNGANRARASLTGSTGARRDRRCCLAGTLRRGDRSCGDVLRRRARHRPDHPAGLNASASRLESAGGDLCCLPSWSPLESERRLQCQGGLHRQGQTDPLAPPLN